MRATPDTGEHAAGAMAPAGTPLLRIEGLSKRFGSLQALQDVSLDLWPGEVHCLLGENGAGKSTLCNLVFGVHTPDAGGMAFDGQPWRPRSRATEPSAMRSNTGRKRAFRSAVAGWSVQRSCLVMGCSDHGKGAGYAPQGARNLTRRGPSAWHDLSGRAAAKR